MSLSTLYCRAQVGIDAPLVTVEVHLANGLPQFNIVGLPAKAVQESRDRVRSALLMSGFDFPVKRMVVNLAPADLPKEGGRFDLAIAIGILVASSQLPENEILNYEFIGELTLSGELRAVTGLLPAVMAIKNNQRSLFLATGNYQEARLVSDIELYPAQHLMDVCRHLAGSKKIDVFEFGVEQEQEQEIENGIEKAMDFAFVKGQSQAKRALLIAACGRHNVLLSGPPGSGKSMLVSCLPSILVDMTEAEALDVACIYSVSNNSEITNQWRRRRFRSPHHTSSAIAIVGGGSKPKPGEISLAHNGVLFLDELPEFDRHVLEVLREPLETGRIHISRAAGQAVYPASFQLIAAMNPCPCGHLGDKRNNCVCTFEQVLKYRSKISGPLMDRIDMQMDVPVISISELMRSTEKAETSAQIKIKVVSCVERQLNRQQKLNAQLSVDELEAYCLLTTPIQNLMISAIDKMGLSTRGYYRILRVARTIADLDAKNEIEEQHIMEAISYRRFDKSVSSTRNR